MNIVPDIIAAVAVIFAAILAFHAGRAVNKAQSVSLNSTTLMALSDKVRELSDEIIKIRNELDEVKDKNRVLWQYTYALIEQMKTHKIKPLSPPAELESDPKIMKVIKAINEA